MNIHLGNESRNVRRDRNDVSAKARVTRPRGFGVIDPGIKIAMKARMTNTTVMAVRENFLISVFTSTSNEQSRYQIKQAAIERGVEQRRMPDKVVNTCWHKYPAHQPENRQ